MTRHEKMYARDLSPFENTLNALYCAEARGCRRKLIRSKVVTVICAIG